MVALQKLSERLRPLTVQLRAFMTPRLQNLDEISLVIHLVLFNLQCCVFFECIEFAANWADGGSRTGHRVFRFMSALVKQRPVRQINITKQQVQRFFASSDAAK